MAQAKKPKVKEEEVLEAKIIDDTPVLVVTPDRPVAISANIPAMIKYLEGIVARYEKVKFTTANLAEVTSAKAAMRALRVSVEKAERETKQVYFDGPKKAFVADVAPIYDLIAKIEGKCDAVIKEEDEKRIQAINFAIDAYVDEFTKDEVLRAEYLQNVERKKHYYNKTQSELDTREEVKRDIEALYKEQKAHDAAVRAINRVCDKDERLLSATYIRELGRGVDIATILEQIDSDLEALDAKQEETTRNDEPEEAHNEGALQGEDDEAIEAEVSVVALDDEFFDRVEGIDFSSDLPGRVKTVLVEFTFPADCGDSMTKLMEILWKRGIKSRVV